MESGSAKKNDNSVFLVNPAVEMNRIVSAIYNEYNNSLHAFLKCKLKSKNDIEEVAQDVYLRLVRHPRLNELKPSFALLCKIASDIIKDRYRKQNVRKAKAHIGLRGLKIVSPRLTPQQFLESKEGMMVIRCAIESLNKKSRQAIILHRFRSMTYKEIGKEMGYSISMVRKFIVQALQKITKEVDKYYENTI